jgi:hypothetical protein
MTAVRSFNWIGGGRMTSYSEVVLVVKRAWLLVAGPAREREVSFEEV